MSDPIERARHFRDRAAECERLASTAVDQETQSEYRTIASHYIALAEAEELLAQNAAVIRLREYEPQILEGLP